MDNRETVATALSSRDADAVRRAAHELRTTPSNVVRQALVDTKVIAEDPNRKSRRVDLAKIEALAREMGLAPNAVFTADAAPEDAET